MKRTRPYRKMRYRTMRNIGTAGFPAVYAVICLAGFFILFGWIWYSFGPFAALRASGWPAAQASVAPVSAQTATPAPTATPSASASPSAPPLASAQPLSYVQVKDIAQGAFKGKLMTVSDPSKITVGTASGLGDIGAPLSRIIAVAGASGGVNGGDIQGFDGTGGLPVGIVVADGKTVYQQSGETKVQVTGLDTANQLVVSSGTAVSGLDKLKLRCAVSAGPILVQKGKALSVDAKDAGPVTAIGQKQDGSILLLVIDGRSQASAGATLKDAANLLVAEGAQTAAALDSGSSTTMDYLGKTLNNPCNISVERSIASAILVMPGGNSNAG